MMFGSKPQGVYAKAAGTKINITAIIGTSAPRESLDPRFSGRFETQIYGEDSELFYFQWCHKWQIFAGRAGQLELEIRRTSGEATPLSNKSGRG
jgi:hypothetical protein